LPGVSSGRERDAGPSMGDVAVGARGRTTRRVVVNGQRGPPQGQEEGDPVVERHGGAEREVAHMGA
jgi:hypothetical protein